MIATIALYILLGLVALFLYVILGSIAKRLGALLLAATEVVEKLEWDREKFLNTYENVKLNVYKNGGTKDFDNMPLRALWPIVLAATVVASAILVIVGIAKMAWIILKFILKFIGRAFKWAWKA